MNPATETRPVLLRLEGVVKRFGATTAVDHVDLDILAGEFYSLLGPSGCGKTTLLRMIAGFETPDEGRILVDGQDIARLPPHKRPVNTVFQHYALFPHLSVFENVAFGLRRQRAAEPEIRRRVEEALGSVQLAGFEGRHPNQMSGGQRQRVALARALVLRPRVLLLDEPLGALDHQLRLNMQVELKHLQQSCGITFLFVTHDQPEALTMSDRLAVLNRGVVEQAGNAREVYERPITEFVARFMGASNLLPGRVSTRVGDAVTVTLERGPALTLPAPTAGMGPGDAVAVMLRPEWFNIKQSKQDGGGWVQWPVTVRERIYQGAVTRWIVQGLGEGPIEATGSPLGGASGGEGCDDVGASEEAVLRWREGVGVVIPAGGRP